MGLLLVSERESEMKTGSKIRAGGHEAGATETQMMESTKRHDG